MLTLCKHGPRGGSTPGWTSLRIYFTPSRTRTFHSASSASFARDSAHCRALMASARAAASRATARS